MHTHTTESYELIEKDYYDKEYISRSFDPDNSVVAVGQAKSKGEAKRLIEGGGVSINDTKITDPFAKLPEEKEFVLHKGKKVHVKIMVK